ncbi:MAG TPA: recombinase family protein, partial [Solirubrobacteraceae bacterium]
MTDRPAIQRSNGSSSRDGSLTGGCGEGSSSPQAELDEEEPRRRAVAYIRESTEEQGQGFSPSAQREAIRKFAEENELTLVREYCDFHSGSRKSESRPQFQALMSDAAAGAFDCVLVFHTSRFARSQVEARRYKQLLRERLGIRVVSVTQPMGGDHTDPSAFLAESIHEMFDEYYSVSLSFWTKSGLREKARQGHLIGNLPWGYVRDQESKIAVPDPERAPLVKEMFERYATGEESDRGIASWLNARGARSVKGGPFGKDTVRDMLVNAAYAGYVAGLRDKSKEIKGLHEAIVPEELYDRVQEVRSWRARVLHPGRPSEEFLLRKMLLCERCGARMHGGRGSTGYVRRYQCSTRRYHGNCDQPLTKAEPLEAQLIDWLSGFNPDAKLRKLVLGAIKQATAQQSGNDPERRKDLHGQLDRLQELYVIGDVSKGRYTMRRQAIEEELQRIDPPISPDLERAEQVLGDFASFWKAETDAVERRKLINSLFDNVWQDGGRIVAVKPRPAFAAYFTAISEKRAGSGKRQTRSAAKGAADHEVSAAGATGLEP